MERPGQEMGQMAEPQRRPLHCAPCQKDALIQGALLSYIVVVVPVNSENSHSGVKLVLHMHANYFLFLPLMLCRTKENLVVSWCLSRGSMIGILVF